MAEYHSLLRAHPSESLILTVCNFKSFDIEFDSNIQMFERRIGSKDGETSLGTNNLAFAKFIGSQKRTKGFNEKISLFCTEKDN